VPVLAQPAAQGEDVDAGQHEVEDDEVVRLGDGEMQAGDAAGRDVDDLATVLHVVGDIRREVGVVFDDEHDRASAASMARERSGAGASRFAARAAPRPPSRVVRHPLLEGGGDAGEQAATRAHGQHIDAVEHAAGQVTGAGDDEIGPPAAHQIGEHRLGLAPQHAGFRPGEAVARESSSRRFFLAGARRAAVSPGRRAAGPSASKPLRVSSTRTTSSWPCCAWASSTARCSSGSLATPAGSGSRMRR
jgi:hypothetical protein